MCGRQPTPLAGKVLGARWRSAVWGGGTGAARGAEQVRKDVPGVFGSHPAGLSSGPGKLLASTSSSSSSTTLPGWGRAPGSWCFFPGEAELLGTALGGRELWEPAPRAA